MSQVFQNWVARYNGPSSMTDEAQSLVTRALTSDVYVTGYSWGNHYDVVTLKYDICASLDFVNRYHYGMDYGYNIDINSTGDIFIAGNSYLGSTFGDQFLAIKYNYYGAQQWVINDGPYGNDVFKKVKTYPNFVYFGGSSCNNDPNKIHPDLCIMKLNENGTHIWTRYYGNTYENEYLQDMTVDNDGNLYCIALDEDIVRGYQWTIIKYNGIGERIWTSSYNGYQNGNDIPVAIAVDNTTGNVFVTGQTLDFPYPPHDGSSEGFEAFTTIKLNANGQIAWAKNYYGQGTIPLKKAIGTSIAVRNNEAYVTGYATGTKNNRDFITIKYNTNGVQQWLKDYSYIAAGEDVARKLAMDVSGNVYVTGQSYGVVWNDIRANDYTTIKYDNNGNQQWVMRYNGLGGQLDEPCDIKVIEEDVVYVTGRSDANPDPSINDFDYVTIRYSNGWIPPVCDNPGDNPGNPLRYISRLNDSTAFAIGDLGSVKLTSNRGLNWRNIQSGYTNRFNNMFLNSNSVVIAGEAGTVLLTTNFGNNWLNRTINTNKEINSVQLVGANLIYCAGTRGLIYKSVNSGINWANISIDTSFTINSLYFTDSSRGFIAGNSGLLLRTNNSGLNWQAINLGINTKLNKISFINPQKGILIGNSGIIYMTANGGNSWQSRVVQFSNNFNDVYFLNNNTGYISGSDGLILCTNDGGNTWKKQKTYCSLNLTSVTFLDSAHGIAVSEEGELILTSLGEKSNESYDNIITGKIENNTVISSYNLEQNYPNPFNPVTEIKYYVPEDSRISIRVYDITGKLVTELVNDIKSKGSYNALFNAVNFASGIYYYQMIAYDLNSSSEIYSASKKMMLIK